MKSSLVRSVSAVAVLAAFAFAPLAFANPFGGAISGVSRAPAFGARVHAIIYNGGERADFTVAGDGDTTLNVIVKNSYGDVITRTSGPGDQCHVFWYPSSTATYYIYVVNEGSVYNEYRWRAF